MATTTTIQPATSWSLRQKEVLRSDVATMSTHKIPFLLSQGRRGAEASKILTSARLIDKVCRGKLIE